MRLRPIVVVGGLLASVAAIVGIWSIAVLRTCDEDSNVGRGSLSFRMCGMDREFIATIPARAPQGDVVFSWKNADGNKPGRRWLNYVSKASSPELRRHLVEFLKTSGFGPQGNDGEIELWSNGRTVLGFAIRPGERGASNRIEIVHNIGLD